MDRFEAEQDAGLDDVCELLRRERPALTSDELERVDRRLHPSRAPPRAIRPRSRLLVVICLALGLLFMTAGTGLAVSGFATPGAADHAQYPDRTADAARAGRHSSPSSLGEIRPAGRTSTAVVPLRQAETRSDLPFTGFAAIPILLTGIALIITGAAVNRSTRGSRGP